MKTSKEYIEKHGLLRKLNVAFGLAHITSVNIKTDDGLINGAPCILKKIQFVQRDDIPSILWVLFNDKMIGRQWRVRYWYLYTEDINQNWTPIYAVDRHFKARNAQVIRTQFPLKPAAGSTIHSGQRCTFDHTCRHGYL